MPAAEYRRSRNVISRLKRNGGNLRHLIRLIWPGVSYWLAAESVSVAWRQSISRWRAHARRHLSAAKAEIIIIIGCGRNRLAIMAAVWRIGVKIINGVKWRQRIGQ